MLILFADSFRGRLQQIAIEPAFQDCVGNLAMAYRNGRHIVSGPAHLLDSIAKLDLLAKDVRDTFKQIKLRHTERGKLQAQVTHWVAIEPAAEMTIRKERVNAQCIYHVPYTYFQDPDRVAACRFIAEDREDATLYRCAAEGYVFRQKDLRDICINLHAYGGGGVSLADALLDHAKHGLTLCVVDSDKKWPTAPLGNTAKKAQEMACKTPNIVGEVYVLPCHELENMLPATLVLDSLDRGDAKTFRHACLQAQTLGLLGAGDPIYYLDLKGGFCLFDIFDLKCHKEKKAYLLEMRQSYFGRVKAPSHGFCKDRPQCSKRKSCTCVLFAGLGEQVVTKVASYLERLSAQKRGEYLFRANDATEPLWNEVCQLIFSWGCSHKRLRT